LWPNQIYQSPILKGNGHRNGVERSSAPKVRFPRLRLSRDDSPFVFAGLWEGWKDLSIGQWFHTCTIITGDPNELVAQLHTRMPVILPVEHHAAWLGEVEDGDLKALLNPFPAEDMKMWPISPKNNDAS